MKPCSGWEGGYVLQGLIQRRQGNGSPIQKDVRYSPDEPNRTAETLMAEEKITYM
jgi:hypothetical protein